MATTTSKLSMGTVLMLAFVVFTASALQLTMEQWQDFLFDKEEYINWCSQPPECFPVNGSQTIYFNNKCPAYVHLRHVMNEYSVNTTGHADDDVVKRVVLNSMFCQPESTQRPTTLFPPAASNSTEPYHIECILIAIGLPLFCCVVCGFFWYLYYKRKGHQHFWGSEVGTDDV